MLEPICCVQLGKAECQGPWTSSVCPCLTDGQLRKLVTSYWQIWMPSCLVIVVSYALNRSLHAHIHDRLCEFMSLITCNCCRGTLYICTVHLKNLNQILKSNARI